jgi:hypothetical protein
MRALIDKVKLEVSEGEVRTLLYNLRRGLEHTVDTHWVSHPDVWRSHEADRLQMIETLCGLLGESFSYFIESIQERLDKLTAAKK